MKSLRTKSEQRFLLMIFYKSPWARLSDFCYGLKKESLEDDGALRWNIPEKPAGWRWVLAKIGDWAEVHDHMWRAKYAAKGKNPPRIWKRR